MSDSDPTLVVAGLASTVSNVEKRLVLLSGELHTDPEVVADLLVRWNADVLIEAFKLVDDDTVVKVLEAIAEAQPDEP